MGETALTGLVRSPTPESTYNGSLTPSTANLAFFTSTHPTLTDIVLKGSAKLALLRHATNGFHPSPLVNSLTPEDIDLPPTLSASYRSHSLPDPSTTVPEGTFKPVLRRTMTDPIVNDSSQVNGIVAPIHNKHLDHVVRTPGRQPSPQPTHLSVPGSSYSRVVPDQGSGYVAPKFDGKEKQMELGKVSLQA